MNIGELKQLIDKLPNDMPCVINSDDLVLRTVTAGEVQDIAPIGDQFVIHADWRHPIYDRTD